MGLEVLPLLSFQSLHLLLQPAPTDEERGGRGGEGRGGEGGEGRGGEGRGEGRGGEGEGRGGFRV